MSHLKSLFSDAELFEAIVAHLRDGREALVEFRRCAVAQLIERSPLVAHRAKGEKRRWQSLPSFGPCGGNRATRLNQRRLGRKG
jgi:hypothetical protein